MPDMDTPASAGIPPNDREITIYDLDQQPHGQGDVDLLYRIYVDKRIESQSGFYQSRIKENVRNADFTFASGALVMTISSLVATISASVRHPFWTPFLTVMSAMLPAFAALMASFRQLYGWERQASIYRDALLGLERVRLLAPDNDRVSAADLRQVYPQLVTSSETVFTGEVSQWGQFVVSGDKAETKADQALLSLFNKLELTDSQRDAVQAILSAGKTDVSVTSTVVKQVTASTQPQAAAASSLPMETLDMDALAAAAASEVDDAMIDLEGLAAAAASEVSADDPASPLPYEGDGDKSVG